LGGGLALILCLLAVTRLVYDPRTTTPPTRTVTLRNDPEPPKPGLKVSPTPTVAVVPAPDTTGAWPPEIAPDDANPIQRTQEGWGRRRKDVLDGPLPEEWSAPVPVPKTHSYGIDLIVPNTFVAIKTNNYEVVQDHKGKWYGPNGGPPPSLPYHKFTTEWVQFRAANKSSVGRRYVFSLVKRF